MKYVAFHPEARVEAVESARYYEAKQVGLGKKFSIALQDGLARIQNQPRLYPQVGVGCRRALLQHFKYGVIFLERGDEFQIIAVMHLRRDPDCWKKRLE